MTNDGPDHARRNLLIVGLVSSCSAFVISAVQDDQLGDQPQLMLAFGGVLAFATGLLRLAHPALLGLVSMVGFPVWAFTDLALHGGHTLLPIEFAFYGIYGCLAIVVSLIGAGLNFLIRRLHGLICGPGE